MSIIQGVVIAGLCFGSMSVSILCGEEIGGVVAIFAMHAVLLVAVLKDH